MNPFFERLAARSLEAIPVLQPRRASRFEATETSGVLDSDLATTAQPVTQTAPSIPPPSLAATTFIPRPHDAAGPSPTHRNDLLNLTVPAPPSSPRSEADPTDKAFHLESTPLLAPPEPSILIQKVHVPAPLAEPRRAPQHTNGLMKDMQPILVTAPQVSLPAEPRPLRPRDGDAPVPSPSLAHHEDIHISIGRIEIRAVTPKADPAARRPPQGTPSSLDTYLQRRNGRGAP